MAEPIPFHRPDIGAEELEAVTAVLESGWLTTGPRTRKFEERFAELVGVPHAVALNSATAALHLSLAAAGIGPGDEVIVPTMTFAATAEVVTAVGAKVVLADCDPSTLNLRAQDVRDHLTSRTAAVMPVHYAGLPCDMDPILELAGEHDLHVFDDAAHAFPAECPTGHVGSLATATSFSFYATKTITTGEGGMLTTSDEELASRARMLSLHGLSRDAWRRYDGRSPWDYDIVAPGFKYNLTDIAAAIGLAQLDKAELLRDQRRDLALRYLDELSGVTGITPLAGYETAGHAYHLFVVRVARDVRSRDEVAEDLRDADIGISVHFKPLHLHPLYRDDHASEAFPNATDAFHEILSLPLFPSMTMAQQDRVITELAAAMEAT